MRAKGCGWTLATVLRNPRAQKLSAARIDVCAAAPVAAGSYFASRLVEIRDVPELEVPRRLPPCSCLVTAPQVPACSVTGRVSAWGVRSHA